MRVLFPRVSIVILNLLIAAINAFLSEDDALSSQQPISLRSGHDDDLSTRSVSPAFFTDLERLARLVDIAYCVGTSGIYQPFSCASRCKEFPNLRLSSTWNTGALLSDSCGYVAVDHGSADGREAPAILVAFRGTYSLANTVVDLSTIPQEYVPYPDPGGDGGHRRGHQGRNGTDTDTEQGEEEEENEVRCTNCTVHMGFLESWRQARKLVLPVLKSARAHHPTYPVRLVGHSLGGAVACLAALELRVGLGWDDVTVTTFGEPQAGNAAFAEFVDRVFGLVDEDEEEGSRSSSSSSTLGHSHSHSDDNDNDVADPDTDLERRLAAGYRRVTHAGDPVPLLPLREWGYRPHAGEVFIARPQLSPGVEDLRLCRGDEDEACIAGAGDEDEGLLVGPGGIPTRLRLWQLLFAHRDYFWRLGLCVPGGDPSDWGRPPYNVSAEPDEL